MKIKRLERKDHKKAITFAIEGMNFNKYIDSKIALALYGRYFLYLELNRATQVIAAYEGDALRGVLLAAMENEPKKCPSIWRSLYVKVMNVLMTVVYKDGALSYDTVNAAMLKEYVKNASPDGEICFLAADPAVQGKGIGTFLLNELEKREKGNLIYLYTDDNCTYQFYERKGFERSAEEQIEIDLRGKMVPLKCFLYSKTM